MYIYIKGRKGFKVKVEKYLQSGRTSVMKRFCEKSTNNFYKKRLHHIGSTW